MTILLIKAIQNEAAIAASYHHVMLNLFQHPSRHACLPSLHTPTQHWAAKLFANCSMDPETSSR